MNLTIKKELVTLDSSILMYCVGREIYKPAIQEEISVVCRLDIDSLLCPTIKRIKKVDEKLEGIVTTDFTSGTLICVAEV